MAVAARDFSLLENVCTGSGDHTVSYSVSTGVRSLGVMRLEFDHSPPGTVEVKIKWNYTSAPPYAFMAWTGKTLPNF